MSFQRNWLTPLTCLGSLLFSVPGIAADDAVRGVIETDLTGRETMEVPFWIDDRALRLDVKNPLALTTVWDYDEDPHMLMIQHDEQVYVDWASLQLENARRMMAARDNVGQADAALSFEATGRSETIGGLQTTEIMLLNGSGETRLWLATGLDFGLEDFFASFAAALAATTNFPMVGGNNDALGLTNGLSFDPARLIEIEEFNGSIVRIVDTRDVRGTELTTTLTLRSVARGELAAATFTAPDNYERRAQLAVGEP